MQTSEVLNLAADHIEHRGWYQGSGGWPQRDRQGAPLCLEGGIMAALGMVFEDHDGGALVHMQQCPAYKAVSAYLADKHAAPYAWQWNDRQGRTAAEVIEVLRACAVIEASREREAAEVAS